MVIVSNSDDIVFAEIVAELHLDDRKWLVAAICEAMICGSRDVDVSALTKLQLLISAHDVGGALDDYPMFASVGVALQT